VGKLLAVALALGLLAVSIWLTPGPAGAPGGTEPALFGPCPIGTAGPLRCPTCGMTGAMTCMVRGRVLEALGRNLLTPLLAALVLHTAFASLRSLITRTPYLEQPGALWVTTRLPLLAGIGAILYLIMTVFDL